MCVTSVPKTLWDLYMLKACAKAQTGTINNNSISNTDV